ncbi:MULTISPECIES: MerR family transcriptional regulator [Thiomicrorhabdus]|uniref:MerR family transcriptional regulator n=1 Tax=Thiomicrorhabdus heinhorstiae TaxID=2748010 RepID=A0ABS0BWI9_9GAMM|nr:MULTISPECIES: MerR family transcriptional regulator [Thiomicrorhabdus]MBF6057344.1 MerR family transcriptional regulator [Thiomicrorhabdus heinhorstiae]
MASSKSSQLELLKPEIPDKKYFTIGEVADLCEVKSHVLRYWEQVFPQLEPGKRRGRRYYQQKDVRLVLEIKSLLHEQGFTIPGAKAKLAKQDVSAQLASGDLQKDSCLAMMQQLKSEIQAFRDHIQKRY